MSADASLARGAAASTIATALSRVTGFVRVVVVAAAMGTTFLANTYQTANTAPNLVFELVAAGVLTSIFVPTFVEYLTRRDRTEGWDAANALGTVALVGLIGLSVLLALGAPLVMRALTIGVTDARLRDAEIELGATFLRLFSPQIALYGVGMIMTGALHAHRRFVLPAVAPIFNNLVVIGVYATYAAMRAGRDPSVEGISISETLVLGIGTTAGVVAMTACLIPSLLKLGWRPRFRFDLSHPAVRKGARLGVWALGYAGGYQAGLIVVLMLANRIEGGVAAYQWAFTFFYLPHALFAVPIFNVLFTAMSEHAARSEEGQVVARLRDGLGMLAFILIPVAALIAAAAIPLANVTLGYGVMDGTGAALVARVLAAFAIGLPSYSAFLVFTRAYYSIGDTKTPALMNAATVLLSSALGAALFWWLPERWAVPGLALGHSVAFMVGTGLLARSFATRMGSEGGTRFGSTVVRATAVSVAALGVMLTIGSMFDASGPAASAMELALVALAGACVYLGAMHTLKAPELQRLGGLVKARR